MGSSYILVRQDSETRFKTSFDNGWKSISLVGIEAVGSGVFVNGTATVRIHAITQSNMHNLLEKYSNETHVSKKEIENEWNAIANIYHHYEGLWSYSLICLMFILLFHV